MSYRLRIVGRRGDLLGSIVRDALPALGSVELVDGLELRAVAGDRVIELVTDASAEQLALLPDFDPA